MTLSDPHLSLLKRASLALSLIVIALDQLSKYLILTNVPLPPGGALVVLPFFSIVHWWNRGVSFGLFNQADGAGLQLGLLILLTVAIVGALVYSLGRSTRALTIFALGLIIGGALGNLVDRFVRGAVADFLYFHWHEHGFPAFNLADSCVCVGVGLLLLDGFLSRKGDGSVSFSDSVSVNVKYQNRVAAALLLTSFVLLSTLTACEDIGSALGMSRSSPSEGKIVTEQPLALPPDYTLKPPRETSKDADPASTEHPASTDPDLEKHH